MKIVYKKLRDIYTQDNRVGESNIQIDKRIQRSGCLEDQRSDNIAVTIVYMKILI